MRLKDDKYRFVDDETKEAIIKIKFEKLYEKANQVLDDAASAVNLKGNPYKGRPLDLSANPYDKGMGMAHRMLKSTGFTPQWIADKAEILKEKKDIRRTIDAYVEATGRRLQRLRQSNDIGGIGGDLEDLASEHEVFYAELHQRVSRLRKRIERYNLETPLIDQQMVNVRPDDLVAEVREQLSHLIAPEKE